MELPPVLQELVPVEFRPLDDEGQLGWLSSWAPRRSNSIVQRTRSACALSSRRTVLWPNGPRYTRRPSVRASCTQTEGPQARRLRPWAWPKQPHDPLAMGDPVYARHDMVGKGQGRVGRVELPRAFAQPIASGPRLPVPPHPLPTPARQRDWLLRRDARDRLCHWPAANCNGMGNRGNQKNAGEGQKIAMGANRLPR